MKIQMLKSETIYHGRVFDVRIDQVRLPNGKVMQLDIVEHPGAVVLVPVDTTGRIWLIQQYRHAAQEELLELPAGVVEAGERIEEGALRELREEIGMNAGKIEKIGEFFTTPGYSTEYLYIYLVSELTPDPLRADEDEIIKVLPLPAEQVYSMAATGQIRDAKTLAALLLAQRHLKGQKLS